MKKHKHPLRKQRMLVHDIGIIGDLYNNVGVRTLLPYFDCIIYYNGIL